MEGVSLDKLRHQFDVVQTFEIVSDHAHTTVSLRKAVCLVRLLLLLCRKGNFTLTVCKDRLNGSIARENDGLRVKAMQVDLIMVSYELFYISSLESSEIKWETNGGFCLSVLILLRKRTQ